MDRELTLGREGEEDRLFGASDGLNEVDNYNKSVGHTVDPAVHREDIQKFTPSFPSYRTISYWKPGGKENNAFSLLC